MRGIANQGKKLIANVNSFEPRAGQCGLWWLGQHGYIVKTGGVTLYIDAYLSPEQRRRVEPLLEPAQVTNADWVLGSHDHADHIDRPAWPGMAEASPQARFVVPERVREGLTDVLAIPAERFVGLDDGVSVESDGLRITAIAAAHELLRPDPETGRHPFLGFVIEAGGCTLYHAGDTCIYEGLHARLRQWHIDVALLPINGRDAKRLAAGCIGNMTYQEAADLAGAIEPGLTLPGHYEMFEANREDPQLFLDYMAVKYPHLKTLGPRHGDRIVYDRAR